MSNSEGSSLAERWRPVELEQVIGQDAVVAMYKHNLKNDLSHAFLLSGPSGVGKTTLARIASTMLDAEKMEIDGATYTGIDAMREVQSTAHYKPLGKDRRAIIIDEAHRLSKQAWDSCLKIIEEPPAHVYWFLCTTEPSKLPATVRNRCTELKLKPIGVADLEWLIASVANGDAMDIDDDVRNLCAVEADGSARKAIVNLSMCAGLGRKEARALLREQAAAEPVGKLCKFLLKGGGSWLQAIDIIANMQDEPESQRISICNYFAAVLRNSKTDQDATYLLNMLEAFSTPYHPGEGQAPLMRSIGQVLFR
jgi:DNA polymerase III gamma/tau subunit